jgi:hypothetical protein
MNDSVFVFKQWERRILKESQGFDLFSDVVSDPISETEEIVNQIFNKKD